MRKTIPRFKTDAEAEHFVDTADLSEYDLSGFTRVRFVLDGELAHVDIDVPRGLLDAARGKAESLGMPLNHYVRTLMERDLS